MNQLNGMQQPEIVLKPVARVKNDIKEVKRRSWKEIHSEIIMEPGFESAIDGLEEFSHIVVLVWLHRSPQWEPSMSRIRPQMRPELPLVGIFATRSPVRPNPLGLAVVRLVERKGNILRVVGLDAIDGTPVLDIKPYFPGDNDNAAKVPEWVPKLHDCGNF